ncbi:VanZ family protein [Candidatus Falkowbacteria bacterium]|nr:VanZ family protein [Candidatus Falkowbacteria bacterium]
MIRWTKLLVLFAWLLLIAKLLTMPSPHVPAAVAFAGNDKFAHFLLFGGLVFFLIETIEAWMSWHYRALVAVTLAVCYAYASLLEYFQGFIPGRSVSSLDTLAAMLGSVLAIVIVYWLDFSEIRKPKLLLHICCIGCGAYLVSVLKREYRVTLYFFNPNIAPEAEYHRRLAESRKIARKLGVKLIVGKYRHDDWLDSVKGHEAQPERGSRCIICYRERLVAAARMAKQLHCRYFGTTLTISPHKSAPAISQLGNEAAKEFGVRFLDRDWKKQDGYKKSVCLSRELGLYRQDYCGCEFSIRH